MVTLRRGLQATLEKTDNTFKKAKTEQNFPTVNQQYLLCFASTEATWTKKNTPKTRVGPYSWVSAKLVKNNRHREKEKENKKISENNGQSRFDGSRLDQKASVNNCQLPLQPQPWVPHASCLDQKSFETLKAKHFCILVYCILSYTLLYRDYPFPRPPSTPSPPTPCSWGRSSCQRLCCSPHPWGWTTWTAWNIFLYDIANNIPIVNAWPK